MDTFVKFERKSDSSKYDRLNSFVSDTCVFYPSRLYQLHPLREPNAELFHTLGKIALKNPGNLLKPDGDNQLQIDRNLCSSSLGL